MKKKHKNKEDIFNLTGQYPEQYQLHVVPATSLLSYHSLYSTVQ